MIRRAIDILGAATALVLASPALGVAAVAIKLTSRGPVLYRQRRVGRGGAEFDVLKLRTMVQGAEHIGAGLWVDRDDARITRAGAFLRRTSLDELPNLWNVLRGEMSLIGPRPTVPEQVAVYSERQRGRLAIRPGITPSASSRSTCSASCVGTKSLRIGEPEVETIPLTHARSFTAWGKPCSGPMISPRATCASRSRA